MLGGLDAPDRDARSTVGREHVRWPFGSVRRRRTTLLAS